MKMMSKQAVECIAGFMCPSSFCKFSDALGTDKPHKRVLLTSLEKAGWDKEALGNEPAMSELLVLEKLWQMDVRFRDGDMMRRNKNVLYYHPKMRDIMSDICDVSIDYTWISFSLSYSMFGNYRWKLFISYKHNDEHIIPLQPYFTIHTVLTMITRLCIREDTLPRLV
jgi:hypothetical protein